MLCRLPFFAWICSHRPIDVSVWLCLCWDAISPEFGGDDPWILTSFLGPILPLGLYPMVLYGTDPWRGQVCCHKAQDSKLSEDYSFSFRDFELHWFIVTAAQTALELHFPSKSLFGENKDQQNACPCQILYCLEKGFTINILQELVGLPMSCCPACPIVPWTDIRVVKHHQGLWM